MILAVESAEPRVASANERLRTHSCILFPGHLVGRKSVLGEFEQTVMLAILQLGDNAYAPTIAHHLEATIDWSVSRGALYSCLNQLERKGLLRWRVDAPTLVRRRHRRRGAAPRVRHHRRDRHVRRPAVAPEAPAGHLTF